MRCPEPALGGPRIPAPIEIILEIFMGVYCDTMIGKLLFRAKILGHNERLLLSMLVAERG